MTEYLRTILLLLLLIHTAVHYQNVSAQANIDALRKELLLLFEHSSLADKSNDVVPLLLEVALNYKDRSISGHDSEERNIAQEKSPPRAAPPNDAAIDSLNDPSNQIDLYALNSEPVKVTNKRQRSRLKALKRSDLFLLNSLSDSNHPTESPSENPSEPLSENPSETPTENPSENPTENFTENPSENPSESPSEIPSFTPTNAPTMFPSKTPSLLPTGRPSGQPSSLPTIIPSNKPSNRPSGRTSTDLPTPAPSNILTLSPTSTSPVLSFSSNLTLTDLTSPSLSDKDKLAIINSTADSMNISPSYVTITNQFVKTLITSDVKFMKYVRRILETKYEVIVITAIKVPLQNYRNSNVTAIFISLKQLYSFAVDSGQFTATLQRIAIQIGANNTAGASAINVTFTPPLIVPGFQPTSNDNTEKSLLPLGAIIGIAFGGAAVLALLMACSYYYYFHYLHRQPKRMGGRTGESLSFNRPSPVSQRYDGGNKPMIRSESIPPRFESFDMVEQRQIDEEFGLERSATQNGSNVSSPFRFEGVNPLSPYRGPATKYLDYASEHRDSMATSAMVPVADNNGGKINEWSVNLNSAEVIKSTLSDVDLFYDGANGDNLGEEETHDNQSIWSKENQANHEDHEVEEVEREHHLHQVVDRSGLTTREQGAEGMMGLLASWDVDTLKEESSNVELGHDTAEPISFSNPQRIRIETDLVDLDSISVEVTQLARQSDLPQYSISKTDEEHARYGEINAIDDYEEEVDNQSIHGISTRRSLLTQREKSTESRIPNQTHDSQLIDPKDEVRFVLFNDVERL